MIAQTNIKRKQKTKQKVPFSKNDFETKLSAHLEWKALWKISPFGPTLHKQLCCCPSCSVVVMKLVSLNWIFIIILSLSSTFREDFFPPPSIASIFPLAHFVLGKCFMAFSLGSFHLKVESIVVDSPSLSCQTLHSSWHLQNASKVCLLLVILNCICSYDFSRVWLGYRKLLEYLILVFVSRMMNCQQPWLFVLFNGEKKRSENNTHLISSEQSRIDKYVVLALIPLRLWSWHARPVHQVF